jgi:uncharacterized damage-inducible protein DinB
MSERATALADQLQRVNDDLIAAIEGCSDEQWKNACAGETWSVGVTAHHVATTHGGVSQLVRMVANGESLPPMTMDMIHQQNEQHAREHAACTREETAALARENGAAAVAIVRDLDDEQLGRSARVLGDQELTAGAIVEHILIGHVDSHLQSIRAALAS